MSGDDPVERIARWLFATTPLADLRPYGWDDMIESGRQMYRTQAKQILAVSGLEQLAFEWAKAADHACDPELDPDLTQDSSEIYDEGCSQGHRACALALLQAIRQGRPCAKCRQPIIDPHNAPDDDSALCRGCGDPA